MKYLSYFTFLAIVTTYGQTHVNQKFKDYWYNGTAEITSYAIEQARYGEIKTGNAVNIFVTEPFSKKHNTKADQNEASNISVLKLNATKKFNTGIYPYSIMTSTFLPVNNPKASLKISSSTQEWCGHEYIELVNEDSQFKMNNFSYFQGDSFRNKTIDKSVILEDDIWSKIRLAPTTLPIGNFKALPSFVALRFSHQEAKPYAATGKLTKGKTSNIYEIHYPNIDRTLKITFENKFPYIITGWSESYFSGWGAKRKELTSKATIIKTLNIAYWQNNKNKDLPLRKELGLKN